MQYKVKDVERALDTLMGGRCQNKPGNERFFVTKSSGIDGKSVKEKPGLVWGDPEMPVNKIAVMMTLNESAIELAASTGVQAIVVHHPLAEAANSGGVPFKPYLDPYGIAVLEAHEAFHGLHPGISYLHGHKPHYVNTAYGDIPGNIVFVGDALPEVKTIGAMVDRLDAFMDMDKEQRVLESLWREYGTKNIKETSTSARSKIILGNREDAMKKVLHVFPHTGFNAKHLDSVKKDNPTIDTMLTTISRVYPGSELIDGARDMGMNLVCGNSHAMEIYENGIPLAYALQRQLPGAQVLIFHDRVTSTPLKEFGSEQIRGYGESMAKSFLPNPPKIAESEAAKFKAIGKDWIATVDENGNRVIKDKFKTKKGIGRIRMVENEDGEMTFVKRGKSRFGEDYWDKKDKHLTDKHKFRVAVAQRYEHPKLGTDAAIKDAKQTLRTYNYEYASRTRADARLDK